MFKASDTNFIVGEIYTTTFAGSSAIWREVFEVLTKHSPTYVPERWGLDEKANLRFTESDFESIEREWTSPSSIKAICFRRQRPIEILCCFSIERFPLAKFNRCTVFLRDSAFGDLWQVEALLGFITKLSLALRADYGFVAHTIQESRQSPILTPAERLPGLYWVNLFGRPYISFFGRKKLLRTPCFAVHETSEDLILLRTDEVPTSEDMLETDEVVDRLKEYLDQDAFATPSFPDQKCSVPHFDFSDVRQNELMSTSDSRLPSIEELKEDVLGKGFHLVGEASGSMHFSNENGMIAVIDKVGLTISIFASDDDLDNKRG